MKDLDWELFDRYLANAATAAERERFERWVAERPERSEFIAAWHRGLEKMESGMAAADREAVWSGALETFGGNGAGAVTVDQRGERVRRAAPAIAAAAVLAVAAGLGARYLLLGSPNTPGAERVVTAPRGERVRLQLPDGSGVMLAAGSTLRHGAGFTGGGRDVTLEGEAYFTVTHDARRPFRVRAGNLVATDLGTEFLVRMYPEDAGARVVVRSGEVSVSATKGAALSRNQQVIGPGQLGRLVAGAPRVEPADTAAYFAWTRGTLVFDATPLRQALPQLSRWYNLDFRLADTSLSSIPLSGRLDQTLTEAHLDLLANSLGLKQVRRGNVVTLSR